jgi:hypothetical protein
MSPLPTNQNKEINVIVANKSKKNYQETLDTMPHHLYRTIMLKKVITHKSKGDEHHQNHKRGGGAICWWMLEKLGKDNL